MSLKAYSTKFELIEVQSTFYKLPRIKTAIRWRGAVPRCFEFTLKAFQGVTHPRQSPTWRRAGSQTPPKGLEIGHLALSDFSKLAWIQTLNIAKALEAKIVVVQLPPSFEYNPDNFSRIPAFFELYEMDFTSAIEFRHASWLSHLNDVKEALKEFNVIMVTDPLKGQHVDQSVQYHRLHGMDGFTNYRHGYTDEELQSLMKMIEGEDAYVLFNNLSMREDAERFQNF